MSFNSLINIYKFVFYKDYLINNLFFYLTKQITDICQFFSLGKSVIAPKDTANRRSQE